MELRTFILKLVAYLGIGAVMNIIFKHFVSIQDHMVNDDVKISTILKTDEDKIKFQNTINSMIRNNIKTKEILINGKKIKITI